MKTEELRAILETKKFKSLYYRKENGETALYYGAQFEVRRDLLKGAPPPAGYNTWKMFSEKTNSVLLYCTKQGETEAHSRRFKLDRIISIKAEGSVFDQ